MLKEFKAFLIRGNVVDLAVAVVIAAAFKTIIDSFVTGMITPLIGMIFSKDFSEMTFTINGSTFAYGLVINAVIIFVSYAAVLFFLVIKPMQAIAARRARGEVIEDTPAPTDEAVLLTEIRDLLAARQP